MLEDKEPTTNAIAKRCNIIAVMKGKPSYLAYKMQPVDGPPTPRPEIGSKRFFEAQMFRWKEGIRTTDLLSDSAV